jgi:hypothetical protein
MRKFKRVLTAVLAGAMASCMMVVPSYAAETTTTENTSTATDKLTFNKELFVKDGTVVPDGTTFTFEMKPAEVTEGTTREGYNVYTGIALSQSTQTATFNGNDATVPSTEASGYNVMTQSVTFDLSKVEFPTGQQGYYRYTVEELTDNPYNYIEYGRPVGQNLKYEDVEVFVDKSGKPKFVVNFDSNGKKVPIEFQNTCIATSITIKKYIPDATAEDNNETFDFTINIPVAGDEFKTIAGVSGLLTLKDDAEFTVKKNGLALGDKLKVGDDYSVELKNGEYIEIIAPVGMVYSVKEEGTDADDFGYTCTINGMVFKDNAAVSINSLGEVSKYYGRTSSNESDNIVTFTNTRISSPEGGVMLDFAPYAAAFLLVVLGTVVLFVRKRRISK